MTAPVHPGLLREPAGTHRVTAIELFFDLVYVFAVTQLSHRLITDATVTGALETAVLLGLVWLAWVYTTWATNWLEPARIPVRLLLLSLMLVSLVMSAALPQAYAGWGLAVGAAYAVMQVGRSAFAVVAMRGAPLQRNFMRILAWSTVSGAIAIAGGLVHGPARPLLWTLAVAIDLTGGGVGFWTPWLGRTQTAEWNVHAGHFAERCQAFLLIALGESIVVTGASLSALPAVSSAEAAAVATAFTVSVALWWLYFDRSAEEGADVFAGSADPGRLGRSAYHLIHPVMIAGIIVTAAADQLVLAHPSTSAAGPTAAMLLGGAALFLAGHATFTWAVWHVVAWTRLAAIAVLVALAALAHTLSALELAAIVALTVVVVAGTDRLTARLAVT